MQVVDADTQKAMMAYYFKKQEEQKVGGEDELTRAASSQHRQQTLVQLVQCLPVCVLALKTAICKNLPGGQP
jgi:hypothetical protein